MRNAKNPDVRKQELMDIAEEKFLTGGFDSTSVGDIVREAGVAQGTFYYYYESKEAILSALLERRIDHFECRLLCILEDEKLNARQKLEYLLGGLLSGSPGESGGLDRFVADNKDDKVHRRLEVKFYDTFQRHVLAIVREGVGEGLFITDWPEETTEILFMGIQGYMHRHFPHFKDKNYRKNKIKALEYLLERSLGLDAGALRIKTFDQGVNQ